MSEITLIERDIETVCDDSSGYDVYIDDNLIGVYSNGVFTNSKGIESSCDIKEMILEEVSIKENNYQYWDGCRVRWYYE